MKNILIVLMSIFMLAGCESKLGEQPKTITASSNGREYCYQGVLYVAFNDGHNRAWGGVKFNKDGKVATCEMK